MTDHTPLDHYNWHDIALQLNAEGWALLPAFNPGEAIVQVEQDATNFRHEARMPLSSSPALSALRSELYQRLLPIARTWAAALQTDAHFPEDLALWTECNREAGQTNRLSSLNRLRTDDYQPLTQHADGRHIFPLQLVALLSEPRTDFTGGEFVMTEQRPRMQSRPMVVPLQRGDAAVIAVSHRPVQGARDIYRVTARQAISRVRSGERIGLEILLHDGP